MLKPARSNSEDLLDQVLTDQAQDLRIDLQVTSLHALFDAEETNLLRYAYAMTGRRAVAEEIVQEVFLQLHARWDHVEAPRAWLYRCVRNRGLNHLRSAKRETLQCDDEREAIAMDGQSETPEAMVARMETTIQLRQLLEQLNEVDQQLIRLKYFEGLKYREISEQTGLTISNVGYRLHHIMQQLASQLRPLGIDESK